MKKDKLEKLILKYTGVASAVLAGGAANGQIIWTDIPDTTVDYNGGFYDIHLNHGTDSIVDFRILQVVDSLSSSFAVTGVSVQTVGTAGNQVLGLDYGNYNYAFRLGLGDTIDNGEIFKGVHGTRKIGYMGFEGAGNGYPNSQWVDTANGITDGYLGVRFRADVNDTIRTFYGWIRLDVAKDLRSFTIKDFAYNSIPDSGLTAGQRFISVEEFEVESPELTQRGLYLDISLPENYTPISKLRLLDLSGKLIREQELTGYRDSFELENLPKGVIIAVVESNGVETSKKVVVY